MRSEITAGAVNSLYLPEAVYVCVLMQLMTALMLSLKDAGVTKRLRWNQA